MELINLSTLERIDFSTVYDDSVHSTILNTIISVGAFDGIHSAHKKIINILVDEAKNNNLYSGVVTFDPHPDYVLNKRSVKGNLTSIDQKIEIFKDLGVNYLFVINFNDRIANMDYTDFYNIFLSEFKYYVVGFDFRFGYKALGDSKFLKDKKAKTIIIEKISINEEIEEKISSTSIRYFLENGEVRKANELFNSYYSIEGVVNNGSSIGSKLGFPTANISIDENTYLIKSGVYVVRIKLDDEDIYHFGVGNIGHNPTLNYVEKRRFEVNIFDFNRIIYGSNITVELIEYLRDEIKFESKAELINQINKDKEEALRIIDREFK